VVAVFLRGTGIIRIIDTQERAQDHAPALVQSLGGRRAELLRGGRALARWTVAIGTPADPTPVGRFAVSEVVPQADPGGFFGPAILTLTAHSIALSDFDGGDGRVAIHGTNLPNLLGQAASHGCIRFPNTAARRLAAVVPPGAPVDIVR